MSTAEQVVTALTSGYIDAISALARIQPGDVNERAQKAVEEAAQALLDSMHEANRG